MSDNIQEHGDDLTSLRIAAAVAHRVCIAQEHDPAHGKLHGCCVVCASPWPCETAQVFLDAALKGCLREGE